MTAPSAVSFSVDFAPNRLPVTAPTILWALADLDAEAGGLGVQIPLPYTRRDNGTFDSLEIGPYGGTTDWVIYTARHYQGAPSGTVTATVGQFPGWMGILVARALHAHLSNVGPGAFTDEPETAEAAILCALGLAR